MKKMLIRGLAKTAEYCAIKAVNSASIWAMYQPKETIELKKLKKRRK